jgi:hypothetical protein
VDPVFESTLPAVNADFVTLTQRPLTAASAVLKRGGTNLLNIAAKQAGSGGNFTSLSVSAGRAVAVLNDSGGQPSVRVLARTPGDAGTGIRITAESDGAGGVNIKVDAPGAPQRVYRNLTAIATVVSKLSEDAALIANRVGNLIPAPTAALVALAASVTVTVLEEGARTVDYSDLTDANAIVAAMAPDPGVRVELAGDGNTLPDIGGVNRVYLSGGTDAGFARPYPGTDDPNTPILEIRPAEGVDASKLRIRMSRGSVPDTVRLAVALQTDTGMEQQENHDELTMDPDSPRYLPDVLAAQSRFVQAVDLYTRANASNFPASTASPKPFDGGTAPALAAWQDAIDKLAGDDDIDLLLAGLQEWKDSNLDGVAVQEAMIAHARAQADNARPRIALNSIKTQENNDLPAILAHVGAVTDRRSVLVAPAGAEGALAGLLGHLEYFQSPTFKTIAQPGVPLQPYAESQLIKLVGSDGNLCVITQRRGRGTICVKGITTDGFQISVVRVADRCIREVKKISDRFIGELNNDDSRTALKQMIIAVFAQMERDGALVPSVDGSSPAFEVQVYASQNDVAAGNARIDIAVRPVRAIDYIYATICVRN